MKYLSYTKYSIYPQKAIETYLASTYNREFVLVSKEYAKTRQKYIWKFTYQDEDEVNFYEHFVMDIQENAALVGYYDEGDIVDFYWTTQMEKKYNDTYNLSSYRNDQADDSGMVVPRYCLVMEKEDDIYEVAEIVTSVLYDSYKIDSKGKHWLYLLEFEIRYQEKYLCSINNMVHSSINSKEELTEYIIKKIINDTYYEKINMEFRDKKNGV